MGAPFDFVDYVFSSFAPTKSGLSVLDIGSQNLYGAPKDRAKAFIKRYTNDFVEELLDQYCAMLERGSQYYQSIGGINGSWLGDILEKSGMEYLAFDIFKGYETLIFDLNHQQIPQKYKSYFDVVLNLGTTEHLIGQKNAFSVIHDSCAVGGLLVHNLPAQGYLDHAYFNYQPLFFKELAEANGYEILDLTLGPPGGDETPETQIVPKYKDQIRDPEMLASAWKGRPTPQAALTAVLRKTSDEPFRLPLEVSTTVGPVAARVRDHRGADAIAEAQAAQEDADEQVNEKIKKVLWKVGREPVSQNTLYGLYGEWSKSGMSTRFPLTLEETSLVNALKSDPDRADLKARLSEVRDIMLREFPLLGFEAQDVDVRDQVRLDGVEAWIDKHPAETRTEAIICAYTQYRQNCAVELFPKWYEYLALLDLAEQYQDAKELKVRLGVLLSDLTQAAPIRRSAGKNAR